ncbi:MAG: M1 family aminopeptidase [Bacteroidota bacterium]
MKHFIYTLIFFYSLTQLVAQQHYCSDYKSKRGIKSISNASTRARVASGTTPPETKYDLKFYHLNVNVERNTRYISGNVLSKAKVVAASLDSFAFLLHVNHTIDSVYVNGAKRNFVRRDSLVLATAGTPIAQNTVFDAIVYYRGTSPTGGGAAIGDGYSTGTSTSWGNQVSWSLSESLCAYQWFPCKQDLTDKIDSSWVFATTDSANMVGSNGLLKNVVNIGPKKRYEWKSRYPIDYYLISVATAKYRAYNLYAKPQYLAPDSILIQNFVYDNAIYNPSWNTQKIALNKIKQTLEMECKLYGMYPFYKEKYGHCMAPFSGGMEHQTMTSLGFFDFEIDAHELGHQWWGDNVTCKAWKDIFINEGWASYTEYLCDQYLGSISGNSASNKMNTVHNSVMSQPGGSSYFTNADTMDANVIFDSRLTYDKGSAIIHSLRYEINNDSTFFNALRSFQNVYRGSTASVIDFRNFMQTYTGLSFVQFFNQWYYGEGYPTFDVRWNQGGNTFVMKSTQTQSMPSSVPLFKTPVDYRISRTGMADTLVRLQHNVGVENYTLSLNGTVTGITVDPNNWILNQVIGPVKDVSLATGIETQTKEEALVFVGPNPTSSELNVYLYNSTKATVEVVDLTGKIVLTKTIDTQAEFDISKFANGMYVVTVKNAEGTPVKVTRIVKN